MVSRRTVLAGSASFAALGSCKKDLAPAPPDPERSKRVLQRLEPWRKKHARPAWRPVLRRAQGELLGSRIGGTPWLETGEEWPACGACKHPLQLFLQLQTAALPEELRDRHGDGLIQLFYCVNDACKARNYEAFSEAHRVRLVAPGNDGRRGAPPPGLNPFPERPIESWSRLTDAPHPEELEGLGLKVDYDFQAKTTRVRCPELSLDEAGLPYAIVEKLGGECLGGDKLAGWPRWVQGAEYPSCPKCKQTMQLVFQLDSEQGLPFMFGDVGTGHVTQCAQHSDVLAFAWACS